MTAWALDPVHSEPVRSRPPHAGPIGRVEPGPAASDPGEVDDDVFRSVFRRHAAGVAVVTAAGDRPVGFAATSVISVSLRPRLISFTVDLGSSSWPTLSAAGHVGVHVLGRHQAELAARFATSGADRFAAPTRWRLGPHAVPILDDVVAWLVCRVSARIPAGDHAIVLAEVTTAGYDRDGPPLLYHDGHYTGLHDPTGQP
jgi:flavin reductase (DIM6/NTAB) family NADH-FMN oxidoreductase RutF